MALSDVVVVKLGGEIARSAELAVVAEELVAVARSGRDLVVVHGGGPQVSELQQRLGQTPRMVGGRRVTDAAALEAIKMVIAGSVNVDLCAALLRAGGAPVGLHGASSQSIRARLRPPVVVDGAGDLPIDFGRVGDVVGVNADLLTLLARAGHIPVLACLGADEQGAVYNINADAVASSVATALGAVILVLLTDVRAVFADPADPATRIARLTRREARQAIDSGRVRGGMIPKLTEGFLALERGVKAVLIVGQLQPGELERALQQPGEIGTLLAD